MTAPLTPTEILEAGTCRINTVPYATTNDYLRKRIESLKPQPVNKWLDAAEDILTKEAQRLNPDLGEHRARRLAAKVAPSFVVPLRQWRGVA